MIQGIDIGTNIHRHISEDAKDLYFLLNKFAEYVEDYSKVKNIASKRLLDDTAQELATRINKEFKIIKIKPNI